MSSGKVGLIGGVGDGRRGGKAGRAGRKPERLARLDVLASWGAALRSRAAGSQDELRCSAIHNQRPYCGWRDEGGRGNGGGGADRPHTEGVWFLGWSLGG